MGRDKERKGGGWLGEKRRRRNSSRVIDIGVSNQRERMLRANLLRTLLFSLPFSFPRFWPTKKPSDCHRKRPTLSSPLLSLCAETLKKETLPLCVPLPQPHWRIWRTFLLLIWVSFQISLSFSVTSPWENGGLLFSF